VLWWIWQTQSAKSTTAHKTLFWVILKRTIKEWLEKRAIISVGAGVVRTWGRDLYGFHR